MHYFVLEDRSLKAAPDKWAKEVIAAYKIHKAGRVLVEKNFGGDIGRVHPSNRAERAH